MRHCTRSSALAFSGPIQRLGELLLTSPDLAVIWNYFHDELAAHEAFMAAGERDMRPRLPSMVAAASASLFGTYELPEGALITHLPELGMSHGLCRLGGMMAIFFYFEEHQQGLMGVIHFSAEGDLDLTLMRFTAHRLVSHELLN